jgi:cyclophilin family peptidyl-prolyl cis-trans isomerase
MKVFSSLFAALLLPLAAAPLALAQINPPIIANPIAALAVPAGTKQSVINLKKTFALDGVSGKAVRFATTLGNIDVELLADDAPATVTNFLNYVNKGAYVNTFFHRSVPGFVIQGGGFTIVNGSLSTIPTDPPVVNEFKVSNTRGTLAMAKLGNGPDTATDQWFFNESDDNAANLDAQNGGFTVFGRVIGASISVMDQIAATPVYDLSGGDTSSAFTQVPLVSNSSDVPVTSELVYVNSIMAIPLTPKGSGGDALLKLKVKGNTNPGLVTATLAGRQLTLVYAKGATGSSTISVMAKDASKNKVTATFTVTVQ